MSIAVSALVRPSRTHRLLLATFGLVQVGLAAALAGGAAAYLGAPRLALLPALASLALLGAAGRPKTHRIDISGTGELRVTVQQIVGARQRASGRSAGLSGNVAQVASLLPGSVVWPLLMVLRCRRPDGGVEVLIVWRDAVDAAAWRPLAVALGRIGRRARGNASNDKT